MPHISLGRCRHGRRRARAECLQAGVARVVDGHTHERGGRQDMEYGEDCRRRAYFTGARWAAAAFIMAGAAAGRLLAGMATSRGFSVVSDRSAGEASFAMVMTAMTMR